MSRVRWGIVSTGRIAQQFASDIGHAQNAEIVAVTSRHLSTSKDFSRKYDIRSAYQGYDELYADPDIDAIYVATPHPLHLTNSIDAMRAGKAVFCEKPIAMNSAEFSQMVEVARTSNVYLAEAMWTWFLPAVQKAKRWLADGSIGELRHIRAELGYPAVFDTESRLYDPALGGGCLLDMGIYPIAIAYYFAEKLPDNMHVVARQAPNGVDDDVSMQFDYGHFTASLAASFRCKLPNTTYLIGSKGHIEMPMGWRATDACLYVDENLADSFKDARQGSGLEFEIEAVSADILLGRTESKIVPHDASAAFQQQMDEVRARF